MVVFSVRSVWSTEHLPHFVRALHKFRHSLRQIDIDYYA